MSIDTEKFYWSGHSRAVRLLIVAVLILVLLYASFTENTLAIRAVNLGFGLFVLGNGGLILFRSDLGVSARTIGGACVVVGGIALTVTSVAAPLDGLLLVGDNQTILADTGFVLAFVGSVLYYFSDRVSIVEFGVSLPLPTGLF